jgi:hypothetical protein
LISSIHFTKFSRTGFKNLQRVKLHSHLFVWAKTFLYQHKCVNSRMHLYFGFGLFAAVNIVRRSHSLFAGVCVWSTERHVRSLLAERGYRYETALCCADEAQRSWQMQTKMTDTYRRDLIERPYGLKSMQSSYLICVRRSAV